MLVIKGSQCRDKDVALIKEWIESNENNAVSYMNILNIPSKKEHILFQSNRKYINNITEEVIIDEKNFTLGGITDENIENIYLEKFYIDISPNFIYNFWGIKIRKTILLTHDKNILILKYERADKDPKDIFINIYPHIFSNDKNRPAINTRLINEKNYVRYILDTENNIYFYYTGEEFEITDKYETDNFKRTNHTPGKFKFKLSPNTPVYLIIADTRLTKIKFEELFLKEKLIRESSLEKLSIKYELFKNSSLASFNYVKKTNEKNHIIYNSLPENKFMYNTALFSLPGILLVSNRFEEAKDILCYYADNEKNGIIPEIKPDNSLTYDNIYNSLFFLYAVFKFIQYTGEWKFVRIKLWELIEEIFNHFSNSNIKGIHTDYDDLLVIEEEYALKEYPSWFKLTAGKHLLLNILWYNAVKIVEMLSAKYSYINISSKAGKLAFVIQKNIFKKFWNRKWGFLNNSVEMPPANDTDTVLQPYQILSLSLPFNDLLRFNQKVRVIENIKSKLLTPVGLRTMPPDAETFNPVFNTSNKDNYYNGVIYPFLLLHYIMGYKSTYNKSKTAKKEAKYLLGLFEKNIKLRTIGHFPELFTPLPPYEPKGSSMFLLSLSEYLMTKHEI